MSGRMITKTCPICSQQFQTDWPKKQFCSAECYRNKLKNQFRERFESQVSPPDSNGCHIWTGATLPRGYGQIHLAYPVRRTSTTHRVAWELYRGPIPEGLWVLHNCPNGDNPGCVNPEHLWLGTHADNMRDMLNKGRSNYGERHYHSKLTKSDAEAIKSSEDSPQFLADLFGVTPGHIRLIQRGKRRSRE